MLKYTLKKNQKKNVGSNKKKQTSKRIKKFFPIFATLGITLGLCYQTPLPSYASNWVLKTLEGYPRNGWEHWGSNGYSIVKKGDGKSYLYIFGEHYRTDSNANPTTFKLHMMKWNNSKKVFEDFRVIGDGIYNGNRKRFYNDADEQLNKLPNGVYAFEHEARIGGQYHRGPIDRNVTFSNWYTVGNWENGKVALLYFDKAKNGTDINANESKIRIRDATLRNRVNSIEFSESNGIVLDIQGALTVEDNGDDVTANNNGTLVKFADGEWHVRGYNDTNKIGSDLYLRSDDKSVGDVHHTYGGREYIKKNGGFYYGKEGLTVPTSKLKSLANGYYRFDYRLWTDSGGPGSASTVRGRLKAPSNYKKTVYMRANDGAMREYYLYEDSSKNLSLRIRDAEPPTASTSKSPTTWTNGNVTLSVYNISDTGGSGYNNTKLPNGTYSSSTSINYTVSENGTYEFVIYDEEENSTTKKFVVDNIDKVNPSVTFSQNGNSTYKTSHSTKVTASDVGSGIQSLQYAWSTSNSNAPSSWSDLNNGSTVSTPTSTGTYYLWVKVRDHAGNEVVAKTNAFKVDRTNPTVSANLNNGGWQNTPHKVTLTFSDLHSGVSTKQYAWSNQTVTPSKWNNYTSGTLTQPGEGTYYLHYKAIDNSGNTITGYFGPYRYETSKPDGTLSYSPIGWTNESVTITLDNISDTGGSGYYRTLLPNGGYSTNTKITYTATSNGTYSFTIYDHAGNSRKKNVTISNIDKISPSITFSQNGNSTFKQSHSTKVTVSDNESGIKSRSYAWSTSNSKTPSSWRSFNNNEYTISTPNSSGTHYLWVRVVDNANNETISVSNGFKVDVTSPTINLTLSENTWTKKPITITVTASDSNGIDRIILPNGVAVYQDKVTYTVEENKTYTFIAYDKVGNKGTKSVTIDFFDFMIPHTDIKKIRETKNKIDVRLEYQDR